MKAVGIVAEYNPFHLGHEYQLQKTREMCPGHGIIAIMSGDFVQRGQAAAFDKHSRATAAIHGGADLVIELPLPWAVSSAEGFSRGAVGLLGALGVADALCFGSEEGDVSALEKLAEVLEDPDADELIAQKLKSGMPYAAARQAALEDMIGESAKIIAQPNNILGLEYIRAIKALDLGIKPLTVKRTGAGHDKFSDDNIRSASQIRCDIWQGSDWQDFVPAAVYSILKNAKAVDMERMECAMLSRLRWLSTEELAEAPDCTEGLENRLFSAIATESSLENILDKVKTKRYAMARLRRILLCAALGVKKGMNDGIPPYARVLAANGRGLDLLAEMKKTAEIPVITKPAHGLELEGRAGEIFRLTAAGRGFYALASGGALSPDSDLRTGPYILK